MEIQVGLKEKTVKNISIVGGVQVFTYGLQAITGIILARLLLPSDFGIVAIAYLVLAVIALFKDFGLGAAIIQRKEDIEEALVTGFTARLILSVILFLFAFFIAPFWARFFSDPSQSPTAISAVIRVLSITLLIESFGFIPGTRLTKELKFKIEAIPRVCSAVVNSGVAISLAFCGFSYWSLVYASLASSVVSLIVLSIVNPWKIRFGIDRKVAKQLFQYGKHIIAASTIIFLITNLDDVFVGKLLGLTTLGYYTIAWMWGNWSATNLASVVSRVMFPTYSKIQDDIPRLRNGFLKTLEYVSLLTFPASFGMFAIAPEFVNIVLGEKWAQAIVPLRILCFYGLLNVIANTMGQVFLAKGRPDILTKVATFTLLVMILLLYPAITYMKLIGVSLVVVLHSLFSVPWQLYILRNMIDLKLRSFFEKISIPLISSLLMVLIIFLSKMFFRFDNIADFVMLLAVGILSYLAMLYILTKGTIISDLKKEIVGVIHG